MVPFLDGISILITLKSHSFLPIYLVFVTLSNYFIWVQSQDRKSILYVHYVHSLGTCISD